MKIRSEPGTVFFLIFETERIQAERWRAPGSSAEHLCARRERSSGSTCPPRPVILGDGIVWKFNVVGVLGLLSSIGPTRVLIPLFALDN